MLAQKKYKIFIKISYNRKNIIFLYLLLFFYTSKIKI